VEANGWEQSAQSRVSVGFVAVCAVGATITGLIFMLAEDDRT